MSSQTQFYQAAALGLAHSSKHGKSSKINQYTIDLFHIVCAHAYIGHVAHYFSIIGETLQRWGKQILSH